MGKGSNVTSTSSTSAPDQQASQAYRDILQRAQGVASTPYQAYSGPLTADVNAQQNLGIGGINANANFASPYIQQAAGLAGASSTPITGSDISRYQDPYTQQVVDATTGQMRHDNAQQMAQLQGNQISQGALGGNATGVAKGILAGQQGRTMASTTAGLYSQGYQQALQAAQRQQATGLSGANAMANYGISGQQAGLAGAGQQIAAGTLQQQTEQQRLSALYQQYAQAQAYPYQQTQWLAGIGTGVGSQLGGTSSGTQTGPAPNPLAQILGLGLSGAGLAGGLGWRPFAASGGAIKSYAEGGGVSAMPWAGGVGWIPTMNIHGGPGAPRPSAPSGGQPQAQGFDASKFAGLGSLGGKSGGVGSADISDGSWYGPSSVGGAPLGGFESPFYGPGFASGGSVEGSTFDVADFDERWRGEPRSTAWEHFKGGARDFAGGMRDIATGVAPPRSPVATSRSLWERDRRNGFARGGVVEDWQEPQSMFGEGVPSFDERFSGQPRMMDSQSTPVAEMGEGMDPEALTGVAGLGNPTRMHGSTFGPEQTQGAPVVADDEEEAPAATGVAGRSGAAPTGGVAAFAPEGPGSYGDMPDAITSPQGGAYGIKGLSRNVPAGLLAAGLGMMASRSPFLGTAVGEGGLAGVGAYGAAENNDRKVAMEAAKLSSEARKEHKKFGLDVRKQDETERNNRATEARERKNAFKPTWGAIDEDPLTGRKIYGWIDPNNKTTTRQPGKEGDRNAIPAATVGDDYMKELEQRNPEMARTVKAVANYQASLTSLSQRGGMREKVLEHVMRYNPTYDQTQFGGKQQAVKAFSAGPEGRAVRALNVSIDHLDTLQEAATALQNGNYPILNKAVNYYREKTGSPLTTNFDSIKQVVSAEIAKAVVGGQTALHDRDDMAKRAANSQSPDQLGGIITQFHKLMAGQMKGLRRAYTATTKLNNFDDFLEPRTKKLMEANSHHAGDDADTGGKGSFKPPAGAIPRLHNGKTYYYDPTTKQPYPGQ